MSTSDCSSISSEQNDESAQQTDEEDQSTTNFSSPIHFYISELVDEQIEEAVLEVDTAGPPKKRRQVFLSVCKQFLLKFLLGNRNEWFSMSRIMTGILLFWSVIHAIRYTILSAKSVTIKEAPPPEPFFWNISSELVQDFFDGSLERPELMRAKSEFTFVMLYAPWESRSKQFRRSFVDVASAFQQLNSVRFVAANCHYHRGHCRKTYKLFSFPVIFALTPYGQPIVFNQVLSSDRLFSWVIHLLNPLNVLQSMAEHQQLILSTDFSIVGHFSLQSSRLPRAFHVFQSAAQKASDLRSSLAFGVVINRNLAEELQLAPNQLHFHTFYANTSQQADATFVIEERTKSQDLINWINQQMERHSAHGVFELELEDLENPGKSEALFHKLNASSATLVLFTNLFGLRAHSQPSAALKNLAKLFNFCPAEGSVSSPEFFQAKLLSQHFGNVQRKCGIKEEKLTFCCEELISTGKCRRGKQNKSEDLVCYSEMAPLFTEDSFQRKCCASKQSKGINFQPHSFQLDWRHQLDCELLKLMRRRHRQAVQEFLTDDSDQKNAVPFNLPTNMHWLIGAGCRLNRTIGFLAMDKRFGRHFMRKWGLGEEEIDKDSVAIVSKPEERVYWMANGGNGNIELNSLTRFLANYINGTLEWEPQNEEIGLDGMRNKYAQTVHGFPKSQMDRLNRDIFMRAILNEPNRTYDTVIFFTGGQWHGPSRSVVHFLHQTKHYFHEFREHIKFYILDTTKNSLPWAYKFERLPVVGFFPAKSPQQSHVFPTELAFSLPNLLAFLLPRCQPELRWRVALAACKQQWPACLAKNGHKIDRALEEVRAEIRTLRRIIWQRLWRSRRISMQMGKSAGIYTLQRQLRRFQHQQSKLFQLQMLISALKKNMTLANDPAEQLEFGEHFITRMLRLSDEGDRNESVF